MKAIRIHKHGDSSVLQIDEITEPNTADNEVKIKIKASGLNHMDLWVRKGIPGIGSLPLTLGCDASGEVVECGSHVTNVKIGDRVFIFPMLGSGQNFKIFGEHINGTHCEYISVPSENVFRLPECLSFEEGAAFPLVFLTAWHMLITKGQLKKGNSVLVMGAASGVGSAAIQIARLFEAKVIATAGSIEKLQKAKEMGADFIINHYDESLSSKVKEYTNNKGVDIIVEHVGEKVWQECLKSLAWEGKLVTCGATTGHHVSIDLRHIFIKQQQIIGSTMGTKEEMSHIQNYMDLGKLKPVLGKVFPYTQVKEAHQYLEDSKNFGKVVLSW